MEEEKKQGQVRKDKKVTINVRNNSLYDSTKTNLSSTNLPQLGHEFKERSPFDENDVEKLANDADESSEHTLD